MVGITEYIQQIYEDFSEYYDEGHNMCELKKLTFEAGGLPDYNSKRMQQFYLLRYAFAYSFEYSCIYDDILKDFKEKPRIEVVSIGCGAMIDYWSLVYSLIQHRMQECSVRYDGIDKIDWNYKIKPRKNDKVHFNLENAKKTFAKNEKFVYDVYFFPKSISEFDEGEMSIMIDALSQKPIVKDTIYFCISIRSDQGSMDRDMKKTKKIIRALEKNNYVTSTSHNTYTHFKENKGIVSIDGAFCYPTDALEYIKNLNTKCKMYLANGENCKKKCSSYLSRYPILRTGNICYQIIKFERK